MLWKHGSWLPIDRTLPVSPKVPMQDLSSYNSGEVWYCWPLPLPPRSMGREVGRRRFRSVGQLWKWIRGLDPVDKVGKEVSDCMIAWWCPIMSSECTTSTYEAHSIAWYGRVGTIPDCRWCAWWLVSCIRDGNTNGNIDNAPTWWPADVRYRVGVGEWWVGKLLEENNSNLGRSAKRLAPALPGCSDPGSGSGYLRVKSRQSDHVNSTRCQGIGYPALISQASSHTFPHRSSPQSLVAR